LVSRRSPFLTIRLQIGAQILDVEAVLDTGFEGEVMIPPSLIPVGEVPDAAFTWVFPDGSVVSAPAYAGTIQLGQLGIFGVMITGLGIEILVGRQVLDRFKVCFDHGQRVTLDL
jgi:predicted aspartyl protease